MQQRIKAPNGIVKKDGTPVTILTDGTLLSRGYKVNYQKADERCIIYRAMKGNQFYLVKEVHSSDREAVNSFTHEQFVLEQFSHSGIQQSIERFKEDGWHYLVLEYIGGTSLDRIVSPNSVVFMGERLLFDWASQLYDLFTYLQLEKSNGIYGETLVKKVIRSPKNIVRDKEGKIHLIDIGASLCKDEEKTELSDRSLLQPLAAPEFYEGKETDERSDVFTLGAIFYYLLSNGKGRDQEKALYPPLSNINKNVSPALEALITKALQKNPDDRFPSIKAMKSAHYMLKFETEPGKKPEGIREKVDQVKTAAAALCTILAVILFLAFLSVNKPSEKAATERGSARLAEASRQGPSSHGSALPYPSLPADPMLYPQYGESARSSMPSMSASVPSAASSVPVQAAISPSIPAATTTSSIYFSAPPSITSLHYPTGAPQNGRHYSEPSSEPEKQVADTKIDNLTKEERLAKILRVSAGDLEPAQNVYISPENDYSVSIPSGYYFVKKRKKDNPLFVNFDETNIDSSLRSVQISSTLLPDSKLEGTIAAFKTALINSGATIKEEKFLNTKGKAGLDYQGYSLTYNFGPPPGFQVENNNYTHQDICFAHEHSGKVYRVKFCAPSESFSTYDSSEFANMLRTLHFTFSND
ncbi:MAG: serine/threonine protein kinase [Candidatus Xenobiia bacterium LiM19]